MKPTLFVFCQSTESERAWSERAAIYDDLNVVPLFPIESGIQKVQQLADQEPAPFLIARDYVWLPLGTAARLEPLIKELDRVLPNWALCGNRGVRWDGGQVYDYTHNVRAAGLQTAVCPHPVLSIDDNLLLVRPEALRSHSKRAPAVPAPRYGVLLSLQCLQNGSVMAVSPQLMTLRDTEDDSSEPEELIEVDPDFREYYRRSFLNHRFPFAGGELDLSDIVDYRRISEPWDKAAQADLLALYDDGIARARIGRTPSITICCRTQFHRPELLERCILSMIVCRQLAAGLAETRVAIVTDQPPAVADRVLQRMQQLHPGVSLECWYHQVRPARSSRMDLLIAAIERAASDYIWFIDDDDFVMPPAIRSIARALAPHAPLVIVGSSVVINEAWEATSSGLRLARSDQSSVYSARDVFRVLKGLNYIPICSMILPVALLRARLCEKRALGDFNEDYFLLLLALTAPRVEVCVLNAEVASISRRGSENTVMQADRSQWRLSYATFLAEVLNSEDGNSPFLWQQANSGAS